MSYEEKELIDLAHLVRDFILLNGIEYCKDITFEQMVFILKASSQLHNENEIIRWEPNRKPLLTIELEDMNSVPVVKYKGEELGHKTYVKFDWERKTDKSFGGVEFDIEHHVSKAKQNEIGHFNTIKKSSTFKGSSM